MAARVASIIRRQSSIYGDYSDFDGDDYGTNSSNSTMTDYDDDNDDGMYGSWWRSEEAYTVKWIIIAIIMLLLLLYFVLGYLHAQRRLKKGLPLLPYHRWLAPRPRAGLNAPYAPYYASNGATYPYPPPTGYYPMGNYPAPPPAYNPDYPPPPQYLPPEAKGPQAQAQAQTQAGTQAQAQAQTAGESSSNANANANANAAAPTQR